MKCARCGEKLLIKKAAYYKGKPYCPNYCFSKTKYEDKHVSLDEMKMIAKRRWGKGI